MDLALTLLGAALVLAVVYDVPSTILWPGPAPLSTLVVRLYAAVFQRRDGRLRLRPPSFLGALQILTITGVWLGVLWLGWTLVFWHPDSIVSSGGTEIDATGRAYFAGFSVTTLGTGDLRPADGVWQLLTVVAAFSGFLLATTTVTFYVPIIQAAQTRRRFAARVHQLGGDSVTIAEQLRVDPSEASGLAGELRGLEASSAQYPALHWFVSRDRRHSFGLALARLQLALQRLGPHDGVVLRRAIDGYLPVVGEATVRLADPPPDWPLEASRGRVLRTLALLDGHHWDDVTSPDREAADRPTTRSAR